MGISSVGVEEASYARVTEDLTLLWARTLLRLNAEFPFAYTQSRLDGETLKCVLIGSVFVFRDASAS